MKTLILSSVVAMSLAAFTTTNHSTNNTGMNKIIKDTTVPGSDTTKRGLPSANPTGPINPTNPSNQLPGSVSPNGSNPGSTQPPTGSPATTPNSSQNPYGTGSPSSTGSGNIPSTSGGATH